MQLHDYQAVAVANIITALKAGKKAVLCSSPTGTGKSYMEVALREQLETVGLQSIVISPRREILAGIASKGGRSDGLWTPVRLKNAVTRGDEVADWQIVIFDEAHHSIAATWQRILDMNPDVRIVGFTATPYRGTPKSTQAFKALWDAEVQAITIPDAVSRGVLAAPRCLYRPLIDESHLTWSGEGDFTEASVNESMDRKVLESLVERTARLWRAEGRPTMITMPTIESIQRLEYIARDSGVPLAVVTGDTSQADRQAAFDACISCAAILAQIDVVSEGVDLPIRILVDARPTRSPVRWMQQLGRITRPSEKRPVYVCVCGNIERHLYLLEGMFPPAEVYQIETELAPTFKKHPKNRLFWKIGEAGKLRSYGIALKDGTAASATWAWRIDPDGMRKTEMYYLDLGLRGDIAAKRAHTRKSDGSWVWGRWVKCDPSELSDGEKYSTARAEDTPSVKMVSWWVKDAEKMGLAPLDAQETWNLTVFQALPFLLTLRRKVA